MSRYRMAWGHISDGGYDTGCGPESGHLSKNLMAAVEYGNRHHGAGSHWIERYVGGGKWEKVDMPK